MVRFSFRVTGCQIEGFLPNNCSATIPRGTANITDPESRKPDILQRMQLPMETKFKNNKELYKIDINFVWTCRGSVCRNALWARLSTNALFALHPATPAAPRTPSSVLSTCNGHSHACAADT